ncbi:MAG: transcription-repair coupling factor [Acidimicrobiaceae bacterium]|nr:transcription-repair coupling factor [Acidimicrobiaceae bacterium]MYC43251.1 transcription-repair coupling factor [Acidimicrobiaceae bacterium]
MLNAVGNLRPLRSLLASEPSFDSAITGRDAVLVVTETARALTVAGLAEAAERRPILVATATHSEAVRLANDAAAVLGEDEVALFAAWGTLPFERVSPAIETMGQRLRLLSRLSDPATTPSVIVASVRALVQRLDPQAATDPIICGVGDVVDSVDLVQQLVEFGYRREPQVEHRGEFAVRGSIVDVFPSTADRPVRIDLWGDEVERITEFSIADQRATIPVSEIEMYPCRELRPNEDAQQRARQLLAEEPWGREQWDRVVDGELFDGMESWLPWLVSDDVVLPDLLSEDSWVILVEPRRIRDRAADIEAEEADLAVSLSKTWDVDADDLHRLHVPYGRLLARTNVPILTMLGVADRPDIATVEASAWAPVVGDVEPAVSRVRQLLSDGYCVVVAADSPASADRLAALLSEHGVEVDPVGADTDLSVRGAHLVAVPLERGAVLHRIKLAVLSESDLTGRRRTHRQARTRRRDAQKFFDDLREGSYVVHAHHGVARFGGMVTRSINGSDRDYLLLEYRGTDRLYVPSDQIDAIRIYSGGETPKLSRMGGADWRASKAKVRSAVSEIAQELVVLYQTRVTTPGHGFAPDTPWQREFESAFRYQETPDQLQAIIDVKEDMERPTPMDRLVIGDVGFGKTEVALRAVFKAVLDGSQAAVLVPTTLLAQQHHATFRERLAPYPMRVEVLSRFLSNAQAKKVVDGIQSGEVDVVIGTHRLLSADVEFKNLGLLVIDEEQRFGVQHKERIKSLRSAVDVLTLTATPIPRTMEMGLAGIRDMSVLNTAPADRQPILTYVGEYSERAVAEAIRRELLREGQLFFVHNRVRDIEHVAHSLRLLVPEARIAVAHGQMDEGTLERVVIDFWEGEYDVLVCTTIIESGIDMPTVNTLVVDQAELLGLGQLHQLRGRVGRAGQRAYAYLFHPKDRVLSEEAYERLRTIGEATELGSGFRIAMRDLELRGAGNLLGTGQSGHIAAVGYDLYCQMVTEAVAELRGEKPAEPLRITIDVPGDAHLPDDYVLSQTSRLEAYRRLASVETQEMLDDVRAEWLDRFGPIPAAAEALLQVGQLRVECVRTGVREIIVAEGPGFGGPDHVARLSPVELPDSKQVRLQRLYSSKGVGNTAIYKEASAELRLPLHAERGSVVEQIAEIMVDLLADASPLVSTE